MEKIVFSSPSKVYLSYGALKHLSEVKETYGSRMMLVTEKKLMESEGFLKVKDEAVSAGIDLVIFSDIGRDTTTYSIIEAAKLAKVSRTQAIIGFGGIRALSAAKGVSVGAGYTGNFYNILSGGIPPFMSLPYVEIPGTFRNPFMLSERFSVIDARTGRVNIVRVRNSQPEYVLIDPEVYSSLSQKYRLSILMDTFLESIEGYFSRITNYISDTLFLKAVSLIVSNLTKLAKDPGNPENLMNSAKAGFASALGLSSGISGLGTAAAFEISQKFSVPKSAVSTVLLPYILEYGLKMIPEKVSRMGPILGENLKGLSVIAAADRVVETLRVSVGVQDLPGRLIELGITGDNIPDIAERVYDYPMVRFLPAEISVEEIYTFLKEAL